MLLDVIQNGGELTEPGTKEGHRIMRYSGEIPDQSSRVEFHLARTQRDPGLGISLFSSHALFLDAVGPRVTFDDDLLRNSNNVVRTNKLLR